MKIEIDRCKLNMFATFLAYFMDDMVHTGLLLRSLELKLDCSEKILFNKGKFFEIIPIVEAMDWWQLGEGWEIKSTEELININDNYQWIMSYGDVFTEHEAYPRCFYFEGKSELYKKQFDEWYSKFEEQTGEKYEVWFNRNSNIHTSEYDNSKEEAVPKRNYVKIKLQGVEYECKKV